MSCFQVHDCDVKSWSLITNCSFCLCLICLLPKVQVIGKWKQTNKQTNKNKNKNENKTKKQKQKQKQNTYTQPGLIRTIENRLWFVSFKNTECFVSAHVWCNRNTVTETSYKMTSIFVKNGFKILDFLSKNLKFCTFRTIRFG